LGSSAYLSDAQGNIIEESVNYPFGHPRHDFRPRGIREDYQFTQKEQDSESQLHYFEARFVAATLGQFTSVDPLFSRLFVEGDANSEENEVRRELRRSPQSHNSYAFGIRNPINLIDPDGMEVVYSKALEKHKLFQHAKTILERSEEGKRILSVLEGEGYLVEVNLGSIPSAKNKNVAGSTRSYRYAGEEKPFKVEITIDVERLKKLAGGVKTAARLANVLHHELRHAEINYKKVGRDREKAHQRLDIYLPGPGGGLQNLDEANMRFQREIGLAPRPPRELRELIPPLRGTDLLHKPPERE
jgi:RHS repeat-associated protein